MTKQTPLCPKCGRTMERIFRTQGETPRLFLCRECNESLSRNGEPWSL